MSRPGTAVRGLWEVRDADGAALLVLSGDWRGLAGMPGLAPRALGEAIGAALGVAPGVAPGVAAGVAPGAGRPVRVDSSGLVGWDSLLVTVLWQLRGRLQAQGTALDESGLPAPARRLLALAGRESPAPAPRRTATRPVAALGRATLGGLAAIGEATELLAGLGAGLVSTLLPGRWRGRAGQGRRTRMQWGDLLEAVQAAGPSALPIVGVVSLLMGAILAFIGAAQLRRFGAQTFVSELVGLSLVRELASVMTAIVLAGRTGGAYAARLATMQGNEEIDALRVLGIGERTYLVLPMTLSLVLTMPLLYLYACAIGMAGGAMVATGMLDLSPVAFAGGLAQAVTLSQFGFGLVKSVAFALLIGLVSCQIGLRAGRSAAAVGQAATTAVVAGIVGVIALDALFAVAADALGI